MFITDLIVRQDYEGTATRGLNDDGQELGVHSTKRRVPRTFGNSNIVITLFTFQGLPVNVAEFRTTHHSKRHLEDEKEER